MNTDNVAIGLALVRTRLRQGHREVGDKLTLESIVADVSAPGWRFAHVMGVCARRAVRLADQGALAAAARELQLIHNLPVATARDQSWNARHFFRLELVTYLKTTEADDETASVLHALGQDLQRAVRGANPLKPPPSPMPSDSTPIEVLDRTPNATVVKLPWRAFPGTVVQGDTLASLYTDLRELQRLLERKPDETEARKQAEMVAGRVGDLLLHYEAVLTKAGVTLPYNLSLDWKSKTTQEGDS